MIDELLIKLEKAQQEKAIVKYKDGHELSGFVDAYQSRCENDGEATICFASDDGQMLLISESEIADIEKVAQ